MDILQFALLGLGVGITYVLIGQGIVLIYRGSGVLNFAQGGVAMVTAEVFFSLRDDWRVPAVFALPVALGLAAVIGTVTGLMVMKVLRNASALARLIATLGLLAVLQGAGQVVWEENDRAVGGLFPTTAVRLGSSIVISADRIIIFVLGVLVTAGLWLLYQRTRYGIATSAVAENQHAAELLGWAPAVIGTANWILGSVLAGIAGIILSPIAGLSSTILIMTVIPGLAAALVGQFSSFWFTLLGGLSIGVLQSEMAHYVHVQGWADAVPFLVIVALIVVRGRALPIRGDRQDRLVRVGSGRVRPTWIAVAVPVGAILISRDNGDWTLALTSAALMGMVCLSLVLITGYAGQISLAQLTIAGIGALSAANASYRWGTSFGLSVLIGALAATLVGVLVGLPALRCRGVNLAVATIGLSLVIEQLVLANTTLTGGYAGFQVRGPSLFGLSLDSIAYPGRYALVVWAAFLACALVVANVRRGGTGRRLLALRGNERAAAASGVPVVGVKLCAFALSSLIAGLSGALAVFQFPQLNLSPYTTVASINLIVTTVIGGIGYIGGALVGGLASPGAVVSQLLSSLNGGLANYLALIGGIAVLKILIFSPNGLTDVVVRRLPRARVPAALPEEDPDRGEAAPSEKAREETARGMALGKRLEVRSLSVSFGGVKAVDDVSFQVQPGEVVSLIGPNGSGKTTLVDAICGLVEARGSVLLDGRRIDGLSPRARMVRGIGRTFQAVELFDDMSVLDNLRVAADRRGAGGYLRDLLWPPGVEIPPIARLVIDELGLTTELDREPDRLPAGRQRLVGIARTLAGAPDVILLDEPAAGLGDEETRELGVLVRRLADDWGLAVLLIEHDMSLVSEISDRVIALELGRMIATGEPDAVLNGRAVMTSYLGLAPADAEPGGTAEVIR